MASYVGHQKFLAARAASEGRARGLFRQVRRVGFFSTSTTA